MAEGSTPRTLGNAKVRSNLNWRPFIYGYDVPEKVLEGDYDHLDEADRADKFILYKGNYYHLSDFMRVHRESDYWDGASPYSYTAGLVIKISEDRESYQIGTYVS